MSEILATLSIIILHIYYITSYECIRPHERHIKVGSCLKRLHFRNLQLFLIISVPTNNTTIIYKRLQDWSLRYSNSTLQLGIITDKIYIIDTKIMNA